MRTGILAVFATLLLIILSGCTSTGPTPTKTLTEESPAGQNDGNIGCILSNTEACAAASTLSRAL